MAHTFSLEAILALGLNNAMGKDGHLPWHLPQELQLFKSITLGYPLIMGKHTFLSLPTVLPGREHIILSTTMNQQPGIHVARTIDEALELARTLHSEKAFIIGGRNLFDAMLPLCSTVHISRVMMNPEADVYYAFESTGYKISASHTLREEQQGIDILYQRYTKQTTML